MKKIILALTLIAASLQLQAQDNSTFKTRYNRLYKVGGAAGIGIETLLEQWEAAIPSDREMLAAKFSFYLTKSEREEIVPMDKTRYLGQKPVFELKDSLGRNVKYFSDYVYTDSLYFKAIDAIDKAIELFPDDLELRMGRIAALIRHDKEDQRAAKAEILALLDYNASAKPQWKENGTPVQEGGFESSIQDCCYELYKTSCESGYEAFKAVAEKASKLFPKDVNFLNDLGAYYMVAKNNPKKAITYYKKVLKLNPDDQAAVKNIKTAEKKINAAKKKKK